MTYRFRAKKKYMDYRCGERKKGKKERTKEGEKKSILTPWHQTDTCITKAVAK